jgi:hypothetical protein
METVDVLFEGLQLMMKKFHIQLQGDKSKFFSFSFSFLAIRYEEGKGKRFQSL